MNRIILLSFIVCFGITGCQIIEEGEVDYVRTVADSGLNAKDLTSCNMALYEKSEFSRAGTTRECYESLYRKYTDVPQIESGDTISVHLMQAFNGAAFEWKNFSERFSGRGSNAEIVIIANVCEQGKTGCSMSFGPSSDKNGRVIYYSNGVKALQYLNFSYLPVYGPIKYEGGPLVIQLTIIELDDPSDQQKAMLKSLASAGQKLYPPASEVLSVLDSVGSAILSNSSDDILFRYSMTLVPYSDSHNYKSPIVAEGNYAFIRKATEKGPLEAEVVDKLMFDNLTGRLVEYCAEDENELTIEENSEGEKIKKDNSPCTLDLNTGKMYKDYRKNTYLTFQIKSGFVEKTLDNVQTFEMLLNDINQAADKEALEAISAISDLESQFVSRAVEGELRKSLSTLKGIVKDFPKIKYDKFSVESYSFSQLYEVEVGKLINDCKNMPKKSTCNNYISEDALESLQLDLRSFIRSINSDPSVDVAKVVPFGLVNLNKTDDLQTILIEGYRKFYNKAVYQSFLAELEVIENLSDNLKVLESQKSSNDYLTQRKELLISKIHEFLSKLSQNHSAGITLKCSAVDENCYLYLLIDDKKKLASLFNKYLNRFNVTTPTVDASNDTALSTSLTSKKILGIIDAISNEFK